MIIKLEVFVNRVRKVLYENLPVVYYFVAILNLALGFQGNGLVGSYVIIESGKQQI